MQLVVWLCFCTGPCPATTCRSFMMALLSIAAVFVCGWQRIPCVIGGAIPHPAPSIFRHSHGHGRRHDGAPESHARRREIIPSNPLPFGSSAESQRPCTAPRHWLAYVCFDVFSRWMLRKTRTPDDDDAAGFVLFLRASRAVSGALRGEGAPTDRAH